MKLIRTSALLFAALLTTWMTAAAADESRGVADAIRDFLGISDSKARTPKRRTADQADQDGAFVENPAAIRDMLRMTEEIAAEIRLLRAELGVEDIPVEAELLVGPGPPHLYVKGLEIMMKITLVQRRFDFDAPDASSLPKGNITDQNVLAFMDELLRALREVKVVMGTDRNIEAVPLESDRAHASGRTYSMVYKRLADASFLMDGLVGQALTARDVFHNLVRASDLISLMAPKLGATLALHLPIVEGEKSATDVEQQIVLAIRKAVALQSRMGMKASTVAERSMVRVSPSDNYDAANNLIAELLRIGFHLNIEGFSTERPVPTNVSSTDAYALALLANMNLSKLAGTVQ